MRSSQYLYTFRYEITESELCKLESRYLFHQEEKNKVLVSDIKTEPSNSAFIKGRLNIISSSHDFATLILEIKKEGICHEGFKIEYLVVDGDTTAYSDRLEKLMDIGYSIEGIPDYYKPTITYGLCYFDNIWSFGILIKNNFEWFKHKQKPYSYSNSISMPIAKALVNIAAKADKKSKLLDACCGVGTIMLEACFAGNHIEGCDINWKLCENARENLSYFNYTANVYHSDIIDIHMRYDAAIIDLPYNLSSRATDQDIAHIMESVAEITDRLVIVSTSDMTNLISKVGFRIADHCSVPKSGKTKFTRQIWVCERIG
ncbi:MAG: methyltransferase [Saprospiraceae bacterium]|nr:methyltransferase [Saprospiraceae bacterium]